MMEFFIFIWFSGPDLQFEDEVTALQPQVDKLITLGVNKIIALGHSGFKVDQYIAKKVRGVDVVIGGHTNTFLYTGMFHLIAYGVMCIIISVSVLPDVFCRAANSNTFSVRLKQLNFFSWDTLCTTVLYVGTDCVKMIYLQRVLVALSNVRNSQNSLTSKRQIFSCIFQMMRICN